MLQGEHSAMLSTFIKLSLVIKSFVMFIFECKLKQVLLYLKLSSLENSSEIVWGYG